MARLELLDDHFVVRNDGWRRLLTIVGSIRVRYEAMASVRVGLDEVPRWFTWRVGFNAGVGTRRAGSSGGVERSGSSTSAIAPGRSWSS